MTESTAQTEAYLWSARIDAIVDRGDGEWNSEFVLSASRLIDPFVLDDDGADDEEEDDDADQVDDATGEPVTKRRRQRGPRQESPLGKAPRVFASNRGCVPLAHVGARLRLWMVLRREATSDRPAHFDIQSCNRYASALALINRTSLARAFCSPMTLWTARQTRLATPAGQPTVSDAPVSRETSVTINRFLERQRVVPRSTVDLHELLRIDTTHMPSAAETAVVQRNYEALFALRDVLVGERLQAVVATLVPWLGSSSAETIRHSTIAQLERLVDRLHKTPAILDVFFLDAIAPSEAATTSREPRPMQADDPVERSGFLRAPFSATFPRYNAIQDEMQVLADARRIHVQRAGVQRWGHTLFDARPDVDSAEAIEWLVTHQYWRRVGTRFATSAAVERANRLQSLFEFAFKLADVVSIDGGVASVDPASLAPLIGGPGTLVIAPDDATVEAVEPVLRAAESIANMRITRVTAREVVARASLACTAVAGARRVLLVDAHALSESDLENVLGSLLFMRVAQEPALALVLLGDRCAFSAVGWSAGTPFADIAASGIAMCDEWRVEPRPDDHPLRTAALEARVTAGGADLVAARLTALRVTTVLPIMKLWNRHAQWLVVGASNKDLAAGLELLGAAIEQHLNKTKDADARDVLKRQLTDVDRLVKAPMLLTTTVLLAAPYVTFRGAVWRVKKIYRIARQPPFTSETRSAEQFVPIAADRTTFSLDSPGLILEFEDAGDRSDAATLRYNHNACCGLDTRHALCVDQHRNELRAASVSLVRDVMRGTARLAADVVLLAPNYDAVKNARWSDICGPLVALPKQATVSVVTPDDFDKECSVTTAFSRAARWRQNKPATFLADVLCKLPDSKPI